MRVEAFITGSASLVVGLAARLRPGGIALLGLLVAVLLPRTWVEAGPSFCPFRLWSGVPCPGCGLTRSVVALMHGDLAGSLYFHPLGVAVVLALVVVAAAELAFAARRLGAAQRRGSLSTAALSTGALLDRAARGPAPWVAIAALALVWFVRIPLFLNGTWTI